jgi:predicted nucleotidyltransferase
MASSAVITDPVLVRFREAVTEIYGDRLERIVLFGSRARGDARPDSDYDIAVFLRDMDDRFQELDRLAHISVDLIDATGEVIHALAYGAGAYNERTPLMREIRLEGVDL